MIHPIASGGEDRLQGYLTGRPMVRMVYVGVTEIIGGWVRANDNVGSMPADLSHHPLPHPERWLEFPIWLIQKDDRFYPQQVGRTVLLLLAYLAQLFGCYRGVIAAFIAVGQDEINYFASSLRPECNSPSTGKLWIVWVSHNDHHTFGASFCQEMPPEDKKG
jgi:hypothetical protein